MNSKRAFILVSVVTLGTAFTPAPGPFWQPDALQVVDQWGFWGSPHPEQVMMPSLASPSSIQVPKAIQQEPHISLEQLYKMANSGGGSATQTAGMGNVGFPPAGVKAGLAQFAFPFLQYLQAQATPKTTTTPLTTTTTTATTTTTTTTPKPTTTTTTTQKPTTTQSKPTTWSPKMKLSEILLLQSLRADMKNDGKNKPTTPRSKGCIENGKWYAPLTQVERGQVGDWCWGSYCNHESKIVHWDDHKCTVPTTPPTTTQDPNQFGCVYNGQWFSPGADIDNYREYGKCFGVYCDYESRVQHWQDRCIATVAPPMGPPGAGPMGMGGMGGMGGMSGMGTGGMNMMSLMSKKK